MKVLFASFVGAAVAATSAETHDAQRAKMVDYINSIPGNTWTAGHNARFKRQPVGASEPLCGVKPESKQLLEDAVARGDIKRAPAPLLKAGDLPESFDSATNWPECAKIIGNIRDQSNCGCCWAFAAAEAASDRMCIATGGKVQVALSAQDQCFCAEKNGCNGGTLDTPWAYIQFTGLVTGDQFNNTGPFGDQGYCSQFSLPHCHHHGPQGNDPFPDEGTAGCPSVTVSPACPTACDAGASVQHSNFTADKHSFKGTVYHYGGGEQGIMKAIMEHGPVEAAFAVYEDFENYVGGVYKHVTGRSLGGHAIKIVGWGVDNGNPYWRIANSWNPFWGEDGYFRIARGTNECYLEDQVVASGPDSVWVYPSY